MISTTTDRSRSGVAAALTLALALAATVAFLYWPGSADATPSCFGKPDTIRGNPYEPDVVVGDSLDTGTGDVSGNGADTLQSGSGNDTEVGDAYAQNGNATGTGLDSLDTGPGNDLEVGDALASGTATGAARDSVEGEAGND